jgi:hypothetical protein
MGHRYQIQATRRGLLLGASAATCAAILPVAEAAAQNSPASVTELIKDWPQEAKAAAEEMLRKYGPPQEVTPTRLHWEANRPWIRSVVHKAGVEHDFPAKHTDVLEQAVSYRVPLNFFEPLATFNGSVIPDRTRGELIAHCDREATNILALNLAHDIIRGQKTVAQAREAMAAGVREIQADRTPADARELRLGPPQGDLRDPDIPAANSTPGQGTGTSPAVIR